MILNDPAHKEWTALDMKLAKAHQLRKDFGDIPPWIDRSDRVTFDVEVFTSNSGAALERRQERDSKDKKSKPGRRYALIPRTKDGGPMPTMQEFYEEEARKKGRN